MVSDSCKVADDSHYEICLPVKPDAYFPNNKSQVYSHFQNLQKRLDKNPILAKDYNEFMQSMVDNDYAQLIPENELECENPKWYLSHHSVYHKQKGTIRIVFNCSLKFRDRSLYDNLLEGPDLTSDLYGVLLRFRQERVAFTADIRKMFYQVKVPKKDSNLLRFFWYNSDRSRVCEYRLTVHVFGAVSSPSIANYALKRTVKVINCSPETVSTINNNFYVDYLVKTVNAEQEAVVLLKDVRRVISCGGFHLTGFDSNSLEVLKSILRRGLTMELVRNVKLWK